MRILYIVPYVPTPIRTRPYNLIRSLAKEHDVTLVTAWSDAVEEAGVRALRNVCTVRAAQLTKWQSFQNVMRNLPGDTPLQAWYCWSPAVARRIDELILDGEQFDVVHVEHLRGVPYAQYWRSVARKHSQMRQVPLVWDSVDCISFLFRQAAEQGASGFGRYMTRFDLKRTESFEALFPYQVDHTVVTSRRDKEAFVKLAGEDVSDRVSVITNGVDLDYFMPNYALQRHSDTIVVTGKMSYHANIAMVTALVKTIMPLVWKVKPDAKLQVVGKEPPRHIMAMSRDPRIEVTGAVDDLRRYLQRATVAAAPVQYGAGIQNKVLEAMACATPTVASNIAVSAIDVIPGRDLLIANDPEIFAHHILTLLDNPQQAAQLGEGGRAYVTQHHDWRQCATQLAEIYQMADRIRRAALA